MQNNNRDKVLSRITRDENGCWIWQGSVSRFTGYGDISAAGHRQYTHRFSYEAFVGPIPAGLVIDHLCRVRRCCNPDHLEPVTSRENVMRSEITVARINAQKTHCPSGHEYTPENTYWRPAPPGKYGGRDCRTCRVAAYRKWWNARRALVQS